MALSLELPNTGDPSFGAEVRALVEHCLTTGMEIGGSLSWVPVKLTAGK
jgi:hypothetical protein